MQVAHEDMTESAFGAATPSTKVIDNKQFAKMHLGSLQCTVCFKNSNSLCDNDRFTTFATIVIYAVLVIGTFFAVLRLDLRRRLGASTSSPRVRLATVSQPKRLPLGV